MMLHLKSVLTEDEVRLMRTALQDAQWSDGRETSGSLPGTIKQNHQLPHASPQAQPLQQAVLNALSRNQLFFSAALPRQIAPPMFNRYGAGGDYLGDHVDVALRMLPNGLRVRTDISCTLFLSDPDEYQGGELIIADPWEDKRIKLPAGDMLLYDASHVHRVEPVHQGTRYASFFWIESMVRSAEQRKLLFEMDCHLMSVRSRVPEHDSGVTGLTATYHNLLRMWADS